MLDAYATNTLRFQPDLCTGCGVCITVCPHGVYGLMNGAVAVVRAEACMECGACQMNCPAGAIVVESGVGCAYAFFVKALTGRDSKCCGWDDDSCCGEPEEAEPGTSCCCGESEEAEPGTSCCCGEPPAADVEPKSSCCCGEDDTAAGSDGSRSGCCGGS
jgi:NAD-dependent dihydropyrimidine dehydrogenase PreA subunit